MKRIVLLRHGESLWNQENKFTGWTDVDLSPKGIQEAIKAGDLLKEKGFVFDKAYTSYLKRANTELCTRPFRPGLDSGREKLAAERKTLRGSARTQ